MSQNHCVEIASHETYKSMLIYHFSFLLDYIHMISKKLKHAKKQKGEKKVRREEEILRDVGPLSREWNY